MDLALFLAALLVFVVVVIVGVVAFRTRRRRRASPVIVNMLTGVVEPQAHIRGQLPDTPPSPPTTTSKTFG